MTPISLEAQFGEIASYIALVIEAGALIAVTLALQASLSVLAIAIKGGAGEIQGRAIWLRFRDLDSAWARICACRRPRAHGAAAYVGGYLEARVVATIRTMLNYFLAKDIADFGEARNLAGNPPQA